MKTHLPAVKSLASAITVGAGIAMLSHWIGGNQASQTVGQGIALGFLSNMNSILFNLASNNLDRHIVEKSLAKLGNEDHHLLHAQASAVATLIENWFIENNKPGPSKASKKLEEFWIQSIRESNSFPTTNVTENTLIQLYDKDSDDLSLNQWEHVIRAAFTQSDGNLYCCLLSKDEVLRLAEYCKVSISNQLLIELSKPRHQRAKDRLNTFLLLEIRQQLTEQDEKLTNLLSSNGPSLYLPEEQERNDFLYINEAVSFIGRVKELELLQRFVSDEEYLVQWMRLTGPSGSGKSRLALHVCKQLTLLGWDAGFLKLEIVDIANQWNSWQPQRDTFVVIDYALDNFNEVQRLLAVLAKKDSTNAHKIRILLLARHHQDSRWERIFPQAKSSTSQLLGRRLYPRPRKSSDPGESTLSASLMKLSMGDMFHLLDESTTCRLGQMGHQELLAIADEVWENMHTPYSQFEHLRTCFEKWMEDIGSAEGSGHQLPLYAQFAAALTLDRAQGENSSTERFSTKLLSGYILDRELHSWQSMSAISNQSSEYHADLIFLACILGGVDCSEESLGNYMDLPVPQIDELQAKLSLSRGFKLTDGHVPPIEPDALAELYVLYRLLVPSDLYLFGSDSKSRAHRLFETALSKSAETKHRVLNFLSRAHDSYSKLVSESGLLTHLDDPEMLTLVASELNSYPMDHPDLQELLRTGHNLWRETRKEDSRRAWMLAIAARVCKEKNSDITWRFCKLKNYPADFLGYCLLERGYSFLENGDDKAAWQDMNAIANMSDISSQILGIASYNLGVLEGKWGNHSLAARHYELVRESCKSFEDAYARATINLAGLQDKIGASDTAIALLTEIANCDAFPADQIVMAKAGLITWRTRKGEYVESLETIALLENLSDYQHVEIFFQIKNAKGYCLMMRGMYEDAIEIFDLALQKPSSNLYAVHQAQINLAYCKEKLGLDLEALQILERVRSHPEANEETLAKAWRNSGFSWQKLEVYGHALAAFVKAKESSGQFPEEDYSVKLGILQCHLSIGRLPESERALIELQLLINSTPKQQSEVLMHQAVLEELRGNFAEKQQAIKEAFRIDSVEATRLGLVWEWTEELEKFGGGGEN